jgi:sulfate transport system ATP-binding protein
VGASAAEQPRGIVAKLTRAMVIGPIARLELLPLDSSASGSGDIIEAHIPSQHYRELGFKEGDTLLLTPRRARVFVAS